MKLLAFLLLFMVNSFADNSVYIWSKEFNKESNENIISFLKQKNINIAIISVSHNTDFNKLNEFLSATKNKIKVEFLIGDNKWIYPEKRDKIDAKLQLLSKFNNFYIHLDVEPHALLDLKKDREKYLNMYIQMLQYIKKNYPKYNISISIPTFYNIDKVTQMAKYVDKIYLMAYEYKKLSQLQKRVQRYESLKTQIVVAYNCKDFTPQKLKNDIAFMSKLGYKNVAFHSYATLKALDEIK